VGKAGRRKWRCRHERESFVGENGGGEGEGRRRRGVGTRIQGPFDVRPGGGDQNKGAFSH